MKFCIDIDGVISEKLDWTIGDKYLRLRKNMLNVQPNKERIKQVNKLYDAGRTIMLNTSRIWHDYEATVTWLKMHKVKYHVLIMAKPLADFYIDDKNLTLEEFMDLK